LTASANPSRTLARFSFPRRLVRCASIEPGRRAERPLSRRYFPPRDRKSAFPRRERATRQRRLINRHRELPSAILNVESHPRAFQKAFPTSFRSASGPSKSGRRSRIGTRKLRGGSMSRPVARTVRNFDTPRSSHDGKIRRRAASPADSGNEGERGNRGSIMNTRPRSRPETTRICGVHLHINDNARRLSPLLISRAAYDIDRFKPRAASATVTSTTGLTTFLLE